MNDKTQKQIAIYSRKSKFTGKGESIENQIELCKQYIATHYGDNSVGNILIYEDEGFSGGNLERPKFKAMMNDAREKQFNAIVCYRLDRISRNIGDFAKLIDELSDLEIAFISIKEQFDTSSPMGRAMMYIASVFSQLERETIAERIRDNMHELSKTGRWLGGTSPTGYESESVENITIDGKVKKSCKLKTIPDEEIIIKLIFDKFLETNSLTKTDAFLIQNGYRTKNDKLFTRFAIKGILQNPVYMIADEDAYKYLTDNDVDLFADKDAFDGKHGVMAYNRTIQKAGKANQIRPIDEWIVSVGKHKGMIAAERWIKAQEFLEQNRSKSFRKPRSNVALLSGLLYCGNCNDHMRPKLSKRLNAQGEQIYSYLCSLKERSRSHSCDSKNVNGNTLDKAIIEEIKKLSADNFEFIRQLKQSKKILAGNREEYDKNIEQLKQTFTDTENEIKGLVSSLGKASGTSAEDYIMRQIDELHAKCETLTLRIKELEGLTAPHPLSSIEFDIIRDLLSSFKDTIDDMTVEQQRMAIRTVVQKIVWDGKQIHLYLFGSDDKEDIDLPEGFDLSTQGEDRKRDTHVFPLS
ncbi:MAG: recombinase family protein [Oscillospiraceae bacterium]|nr:recombinase family protein [Oscillospiraceae bacterium]